MREKASKTSAMVMALTIALALLSFHAVTAQDSWMSVSASGCDYGGEFLTIEAVDARTVRFDLCYPDPAFASKIAFGAFAIHPAAYLQETRGTGRLLERPVGSGPYEFARWERGQEIVLRRSDRYWGPLAAERRLIIRWNADAEGRYAALTNNEVDGIDNPGRAVYENIQRDARMALYPRPGTTIFYLGVNNRFPPFEQLLVRQAMAHAIDRERIVARFFPDGSSVAGQFMPPTIFGYTGEVRPVLYDPERARDLLAQSGVTLPIRTRLSYRNVERGYLPQPRDVAIEIQKELDEIGIEAELDEMESSAFLDASTAGELPLFLLGWLPDYPDATNFLDFHFGSSASASFGDKFEEITAPLTTAARLVDPDERYPYYVEANSAIRDLTPMIPIAYGSSAAVFQARILGAHSSPLNLEYFAIMEDAQDDDIVWMQNAEPISLYCADELDGESYRVCHQINEPLLTYSIAGTAVIPALATGYQVNDDATEWTLTLRDGVLFHDGSQLDANDVVLSFLVQWDASHPLHTGRTGSFTYFESLFGAFLNDA